MYLPPPLYPSHTHTQVRECLTFDPDKRPSAAHLLLSETFTSAGIRTPDQAKKASTNFEQLFTTTAEQFIAPAYLFFLQLEAGRRERV